MNAPYFPEEVKHVWNWFTDLHGARERSSVGVSPITYSEILSWSILTGEKPNAWEVRLIKKVDTTYMLINTAK